VLLKFVNQYWIKIVKLNDIPVPANGMKREKGEQKFMMSEVTLALH
jgi:hypothetical protein